MAWDGVEERRRGPRADVGGPVDCRFDMRVRVKLLDISSSGALLGSDAILPVQALGQLKAVLASGHFSPSLQIRRTSESSRDEGTLLGTVFQGMDDESRKSLEAFLRKATS
jgi:hypothetical protein